MQNDQETVSPLEGVGLNGAQVMQALMFEKIYGGLKVRMNQVIDKLFSGSEEKSIDMIREEYADKLINWLISDLEKSSGEHPKETGQIQRAIGRRLNVPEGQEPDEAVRQDVAKEYNKRLMDNYLFPILRELVLGNEKYGEKQYASVVKKLRQKIESTTEIL